MIKCQGNEAMYIVRALQGKLRVGTAAQTVLVSLATTFATCVPTRVKKIMEEDGYTIEDDEKDTIDQKKYTHKDPDEAFKWFEHLAGIQANSLLRL